MTNSVDVVVARELVRDAATDKRESERLKHRARRRFEEARAFCERVGLDFEEVKTEARGGHGQREARASG